MKKLLICPGKRAAMGILAEKVPLAVIPMFGLTLVEHWLSHLACTGCKHVTLLAADRPESLEYLVQDGSRWGLNLEIISESRELTAAEALIKYDKNVDAEPANIIIMDHLPGLAQSPLFTDPTDFFRATAAWMPQCRMPDRVGVRQLAPGVWAGLHARVSPSAQVQAPCWLGKSVTIEAGAIIGPGAIIEDGSVIESASEIVESYIGPDTLVGQGGIIKDSVVWGSTLINWKSGSVVEIRDAFILSSLRRPRVSTGQSWLERVTEICVPAKEEDLFIKDLIINKEGSS